LPRPSRFETTADSLQGFRPVSRPGTPFVAVLDDHDADLAHLRIRLRSGRDLVFTGIVNRWRDDLLGWGGDSAWSTEAGATIRPLPGP
jgi:hypothetical protein